jgi:hypothetical protein
VHVLSPLSPQGPSVTESQLWRLQNQLRLLARRDVLCAPCGRRLSGSVRRQLEAARMTVSAMTDQVMDGTPLNDLQVRYLKRTADRLQRWLRPTIRQLELEVA